jgi:hypothetical protein
MRTILAAFIIVISLVSCDNSDSVTTSSKNDTTQASKPAANYKSVQYIDSFISVHDPDIKENNALKEQYEAICTKQMLPLIDKKGFYDDLPFKFVTSAEHDGKIYGNFIYEEGKHYVKVQCIIPKQIILNLQEDKSYFIRFKAYHFENGVSFQNDFSKIELPTTYATLISAKPI